MTLIEFHEAAKAIVQKAGWGGCQFSVTAGLTLHAGSDAPFYEYRIAAHPESGLITSWDNDYWCNNPTLALERFQIAVDRRLAPPSEPEAITEIEFGEANYETKPVLVVIGSVDLTPNQPTISVSADGSTIEYTNPATEYSINPKAKAQNGEWVLFGELAVGDNFECYGDTMMNYDYPKWCKCVKRSDSTADEIDGGTYAFNPADSIFVPSKAESEGGRNG